MDAEAPGAFLQANLARVGFRRWARHFLACRRSFVPPDDGFSPIPYFLNCRAIELELKARHLESTPLRVVKKTYWHNLEALYRDLHADAQKLTATEHALLVKANELYDSKGLEYFASIDALTAFSRFPDLTALDKLAIRIVEGDA